MCRNLATLRRAFLQELQAARHLSRGSLFSFQRHFDPQASLFCWSTMRTSLAIGSNWLSPNPPSFLGPRVLENQGPCKGCSERINWKKLKQSKTDQPNIFQRRLANAKVTLFPIQPLDIWLFKYSRGVYKLFLFFNLTYIAQNPETSLWCTVPRTVTHK